MHGLTLDYVITYKNAKVYFKLLTWIIMRLGQT